MGSFKLILLIPFFTFSQLKNDWQKFSTKNNAAVHFYAAFLVDVTAYQVQSYACPKWKPAKKILVSNLVTLSVITLKEVYDMHKPNKTGFSWDDVLNGVWSVPVYDIINVCKRDYLGRDSFEYRKELLY